MGKKREYTFEILAKVLRFSLVNTAPAE